MDLLEIAKELEKQAAINGADIFVDVQTAEFCFFPVISDSGVVGAVGKYINKGKPSIGYFILNERIVKYALDEGFDVDSIFDSFKKNLFKETSKDEFFTIMTKKKD
jgi:hypothetical protein